MKIQLPQQKTPLEKCLHISQFALFLISFFGLAVLIWRLFDAWWVRALLLVADYCFSSMILYCVLRPLAQKALKDRQNTQK